MTGTDGTRLGDRMKAFERATRTALRPEEYTIIRVDGRAFHTYLRNSPRPFDHQFMMDMDYAATVLCAEIQGALFAYVQSDEISVVVTNTRPAPGRTGETLVVEPWFGGEVQKIASVTASIATAALCERRGNRPTFDSRAFNLPDAATVREYLVWRQRDCIRNSVSMAASARFTPAELYGWSTDDRLTALADPTRGHPAWEEYSPGARRGRVVERASSEGVHTFTHRRTGVEETVTAVRHRWTAGPAPVFSHDPDGFLARAVPELPKPAVRPELVWHYGPTAADPDPGAMWHYGCGQRVMSIDGGYVCGCGAQDDGGGAPGF